MDARKKEGYKSLNNESDDVKGSGKEARADVHGSSEFSGVVLDPEMPILTNFFVPGREAFGDNLLDFFYYFKNKSQSIPYAAVNSGGGEQEGRTVEYPTFIPLQDKSDELRGVVDVLKDLNSVECNNLLEEYARLLISEEKL